MKEEMYNLLREDIQSKIGKKILYSKDCVLLTKQIFKETHRQISNSTIKRFFGIIKTSFNPSKYTLETLTVYLGFKDWSDYLNSYNQSKYLMSSGDFWENLKSRTLIITEHSLNSLKEKTGYKSGKMIFRAFAKKRFKDFLESPTTATMFVAPDGYGKSTLLIQLLKKYFLGANSKYKNDIVTLIDGGLFFNLYTKNSNIELLNQLMEFNISSSLEYFFQNNPEKRKGRIWMIIDNVDEIFFDKERYHQMVENLVRIIMANDNGWYKMILTCRPENLDVFTYLVNKNPILKTSFQGVDFTGYNTVRSINIPLFDQNEIEYILNKYHFKNDFDFLLKHQNDLLNVIRHPYLLSLFVEEFNQNEKISKITLLNRYLQRRLYSPPYREEKLLIIDKFINLCKRGKDTNSVNKELLISNASFKSAFRELLSYGIFYEYTNPNELLGKNTYVKFNQSIIFEYLLFEKWRTNKQLSTRLFFKIRNYYQNNVQLQCNLLIFFIRFVIYEENYDLIKQIHKEIELVTDDFQSGMPPCINSFSSVIKEALQTNTQLRDYLVPWISSSKLGKFLYSEVI